MSHPPGAPHFGSTQRPCERHIDSEEGFPPNSPFAWLIREFGLTDLEINVVLLALAPELDLRYERIYAYLQDDVTRKWPTVDLALNLFCASAAEKLDRRLLFSPGSPLIRHNLLHFVADPNQVEPPFLAYYLKLDDQVTRLLLGQRHLDRRVEAFCKLVEPALDWRQLPLPDDVKIALPRLAAKAYSAREPLRFYFRGPDRNQKREVAEGLAGIVGAKLLAVRIDRLPENSKPDGLWELVLREARMNAAILYISELDDSSSPNSSARRQELVDILAAHQGIVIIAGRVPWDSQATGTFEMMPVAFDVPRFAERRSCWMAELARRNVAIQPKDLDLMAGRFRLTSTQIVHAVAAAQLTARWRSAGSASDQDQGGSPTVDELAAAARSQPGEELSGLAHRIESRYSWTDIVLPPDQISQLREICSQAEYRQVVYGQWGFDEKLSFGKGLNVLFSGPPGTGKTMAAEVIAHELRLDLYRIDLSQIISKYIGETEKNLDRIFTAAENSNAVLFFDEADALFGKRSEVRDSHDRYANIEISYLLQKMEEYQGISILATNLRQNLDEAFVRRLQAIVEFPFPDEEYRLRIWQNVFPEKVPLGADVRYDLLAGEVRLAGGNIKNMALAAAFYAAADGGVLHLSHLIRAARREHQKLARSWSPGEFLRAATLSQEM
ncbi:MAG: ATP-binding protein [Terriglobia bacterium]